MDDEVDWVGMLEIMDVVSNAIVNHYTEHGVQDREVGLQALVVLAHLTKTSMGASPEDFDKFMVKCLNISSSVQALRTSSRDMTKN